MRWSARASIGLLEADPVLASFRTRVFLYLWGKKSHFETSVLGGSLVNGLTKESNLHRQLGLCCLQGAPSSLIFLIRSLVDNLCQYSSRLFHYRESQKQGNQLFQRELVFFFKAKNLGQRGWGDYISFGLVYYKIPKENNVPLGTWAQTVC